VEGKALLEADLLDRHFGRLLCGALVGRTFPECAAQPRFVFTG
jgi:hypothetical protein